MGKIIFYIVLIILILLAGSTIWPYWNKYVITSDLKAVALYGTKHSLEDTRKFLNKKIEEKGYIFDPEDLDIRKDENNTVSISLTYQDKISLFGIVLKELEFTVDVKQRFVREVM